MTSSSSWDAMPCQAQNAEMPKHTLDCPMFNREEFARLGEEWKLTFQYTHITPLLKERYHTLSLLQRNDGDVHLVIFDKGRPHGWWQWYTKNNQIDIHFKYSGSNEHDFPHHLKCISEQGSRSPAWRFEKIDLEREKGEHKCYLSMPKYERISTTQTYQQVQSHTTLTIQHQQQSHPTCKYYWQNNQWHIFNNWLEQRYSCPAHITTRQCARSQSYLAIRDQHDVDNDTNPGQRNEELVWV